MTIIDFLSNDDQQTLAYKIASKKFAGNDYCRITTVEDLEARLSMGNFESNHLIILAHGGRNGIASAPNNGLQMSYKVVLESLSRMPNADDFELNLCAICSSENITHDLAFAPENLKLIWCTSNTVNSIEAAFIIKEYREQGIHMLSEKGKYISITLPM